MFGMNRKVERLMLAMANFEGWRAPENNKIDEGSRSYRHHNPGNLRSSPFAKTIKDGFAVFDNDIVGMMAFHWDLRQKSLGNTWTSLGPDSTVSDLITVWAPVSDGNNPLEYAESVLRESGLPRDLTLKELFEN